MITAFRVPENPNDEAYGTSHPHPPEYHEQSAGQSPHLNGSVGNPKVSSAEVISKHQCCCCVERRASQLLYCSQCREIFCLYHWPSERPHNPKSQSSASHRQVDLSIHDWVQSTLNADVHPTVQERLHCEDLGSLWFGLNIDNGSNDAKFINTDVYEDLIAASTHPDKSQQFPSLVSFVGPTGAGKSTLIVSIFQFESMNFLIVAGSKFKCRKA